MRGYRPLTPQASTSLCPICNRTIAKSKNLKPLYNGFACKSCVNGFASRRQAAYLIDSAVFFALVYGATWALLYLNINVNWPNDILMTTLPVPFSLVAVWLYSNIQNIAFYFKDGFKGKSPGKILCGVTAVDESTREPISMGRSFKRNIPLMIPFAVLVALVQMGKGRRLGDNWANTRVIWDKHKHKFPFEDRGFVCHGCGYDLTGNVSGKCPECGTAAPQYAPQAKVVAAADVQHPPMSPQG